MIEATKYCTLWRSEDQRSTGHLSVHHGQHQLLDLYSSLLAEGNARLDPALPSCAQPRYKMPEQCAYHIHRSREPPFLRTTVRDRTVRIPWPVHIQSLHPLHTGNHPRFQGASKTLTCSNLTTSRGTMSNMIGGCVFCAVSRRLHPSPLHHRKCRPATLPHSR